ncbi:hypothetical protein OXYTRIMIC_407 [Oxytricha trifallax]|uniref:Uncharacterized protein n=1 Tax=Oxytricha trifallax TaxID=1172189 RepID=A0A073HZD0_9SPIT|nr:hypothetical protein OXYTRIMIC_407 [Oxytricha trifallax]
MDTNKVSEPIDCGVMPILIANHFALELKGEPVFQIFLNDWINMQRQQMIFNLEVGFTKMEIGKSGHSVRDDEAEMNTKKQNSMLWRQADEGMDSGLVNANISEDGWDKLVQRNEWQAELERQYRKEEEQLGDITRRYQRWKTAYLSVEQGWRDREQPNVPPTKIVQEPLTILERIWSRRSKPWEARMRANISKKQPMRILVNVMVSIRQFEKFMNIFKECLVIRCPNLLKLISSFLQLRAYL